MDKKIESIEDVKKDRDALLNKIERSNKILFWILIFILILSTTQLFVNLYNL